MEWFTRAVARRRYSNTAPTDSLFPVYLAAAAGQISATIPQIIQPTATGFPVTNVIFSVHSVGVVNVQTDGNSRRKMLGEKMESFGK